MGSFLSNCYSRHVKENLNSEQLSELNSLRENHVPMRDINNSSSI